MRATLPALAAACLLAGAAIAGCGGDSGSDSSATESAPAPSRPAPPRSAFPSPEGRSLRQVLKGADGPAELLVEPAASAFYPGLNRYPFGVLERKSGVEMPDAEVALYYAKVKLPKPGAKSRSGNRGQLAKAQEMALDQPAVGPFPAAIETLATDPRFRSQSTRDDPLSASVVYSAELPFRGEGEWRIAAIVKEDGERKGVLLPGVAVGEFKRIPEIGQKAPKIHTPTAEGGAGKVSKITTRVPPDTQNKEDYAEALGREPIVLLFATPQFCQSRVCGPVVDVAEQAKHEYGDKAAFIHMEIYKDNDPDKGTRPQVRAFHLPSEPWLFTIDRKGFVRDAVEGPFGLKLMHEAVDKAIAP